MLVDAAVFAVACALLVSMPHATRPEHALESVSLSTALEDIALAASLKPDLVASACEGAQGEFALQETFRQATGTFSANAFFVHCPNGKEIPLSGTTAPYPVAARSIYTNRVIVPRNGRAFLVVFTVKSAGG